MIYNLTIPEDDYHNLARGHVFVVRDVGNKSFNIGEEVIINNRRYQIRAIESAKPMTSDIGLLVIEYR